MEKLQCSFRSTISIMMFLASDGKVLPFWPACGQVGIQTINIVVSSYVLQSFGLKGPSISTGH